MLKYQCQKPHLTNDLVIKLKKKKENRMQEKKRAIPRPIKCGI